MRGGFREKIMDAGRELFPSPLGPALTGDDSVGGDGVSGGGVCHRGGVSAGVTLTGVTLLEDFLLSLPEPFFPPRLEINERTNPRKGESITGTTKLSVTE
jgi:hypothetical protein